jgi:hypothetical protein
MTTFLAVCVLSLPITIPHDSWGWNPATPSVHYEPKKGIERSHIGFYLINQASRPTYDYYQTLLGPLNVIDPLGKKHKAPPWYDPGTMPKLVWYRPIHK